MEPRLFLVFARDEVLHLHLGGTYNQLELQQNYFEALDFLAAKNLSKIALDITKLKQAVPAITLFLQENWHQLSEEKGLKAIAIITENSVLSKLKEADKALINNQGPVHYFISDKSQPALKWLAELS